MSDRPHDDLEPSAKQVLDENMRLRERLDDLRERLLTAWNGVRPGDCYEFSCDGCSHSFEIRTVRQVNFVRCPWCGSDWEVHTRDP